MKKFLTLTLAAVLALGPVCAHAEGGEASNEGIMPLNETAPLPFTDVTGKDWFYENVAACYEDGIMGGTEPTVFSPYDLLPEEQTATLCARLRAQRLGEEIPAQAPGEAWYGPYLRYLADLELSITPGVQCTRARFLTMLGAVLDDQVLTPVYTVDLLPDTKDETVLRFYRAGILNGMDKYGSFIPNKTLTRAEAATMVSRILVPGLRVAVEPADYTPFRAAGVAPAEVFFTNGVTAEQYLTEVNARIAFLEYVCDYNGIEFNWFNTYGPYAEQTFLEYVTDGAVTALGVNRSMGTQYYGLFDVQVYYTRLIDLRSGEPLMANAVAPAEAL